MFPSKIKKMRFFTSVSVLAISVMFCGVSPGRGLGLGRTGGQWPTHQSKKGQRIFRSPEDAARALIEAMSANDRQELTKILGHEGERIVFSADNADERAACERFVRAYREKNRIIEVSGSRAVLEMGNEDQPFPLPIAKVQGYWRFSAKHGRVGIHSTQGGKK